MTAPLGYDEVEAIESFDDFELADEAFPFKVPIGRRISVGGTGLSSATLHTPKGPARLNLPSPVPTLAQFRALEQALNASTARVNAVQAELVKVRRELVLRRRDPQGQGMMSLLIPLMLKRKFDNHVHDVGNQTSDTPKVEDGGSDISSLLPVLLLQPGIFGQSTTTPAGGGQDSTSQLLLMMVLMEAL
jgi:hypothetical protein